MFDSSIMPVSHERLSSVYVGGVPSIVSEIDLLMELEGLGYKPIVQVKLKAGKTGPMQFGFVYCPETVSVVLKQYSGWCSSS